jgi:hypothetical protein
LSRVHVLCALLLGLVIGFGSGASGAELVTVDAMTVIAWPSLILRAAPSTGGEAVVGVPFGESVVVIGDGEEAPVTTLGGVEGRWRQVRWGSFQGWMFDAWLLGLPAPPASCDGFDAWIGRWVPVGPVVTQVDGPPTGEPELWRVQSFDGGMRVARLDGDEPSAGRLWLPDVALPQAWSVARRCHPGLAPLAEVNWPPHSLAGLRVTRSEVELEVSADGRSLLSLEQRPEGVWLSWR